MRRIRSTAVVRCVTPAGGGVEFLHMAQQDRERLRRLIRRLQPRMPFAHPAWPEGL